MTSEPAKAPQRSPAGWIQRLESSQALATAPIEQAAPPVPPFAVAVEVPEHRDRHPAELFAAAGPLVQQVVVAALVVSVVRAPAAPGDVRQGAAAIAFCLPARPGSRRCYHSPQSIP